MLLALPKPETLKVSLKQDAISIVDNLRSTKTQDIHHGLAQLDKLLKSLIPSIRRAQTSGTMDSKLTAFTVLQESFHYNIAAAMISLYQNGSFYRNSSSLVWANTLLMGLLLIHADSRDVFSNNAHMLLMLLFLDPSHHAYMADTCASFVSLMIHILLKNPKNMRVFERCGGCLIIIRLLSLSPTEDESHNLSEQQTVYFKLVEFLIFYMTEEPENIQSGVPTLSVQEKANLFRPDFPGIEELVENLNDLTTMNQR